MSVLDNDRQQLADSLRALLTKKCDSSAVRAAIETPDRFDRQLWAVLSEQIGAAGMAVPEEYGGAGGGLVEATIVAEELGRVLAPSPALGSSGLATALVLATDDSEVKHRLLPKVSAGEIVLSVCAADAAGVWGRTDIEASAHDGNRLTGVARYVLDAPIADVFLVAAVGTGGLGIYEVHARSQGVTVGGGSTMDPTRRLYEVRFDGAEARPLAVTDAATALRSSIEVGSILLAGEQAGAAAKCLELTVEYSKSRVQFGRQIGSFQALKHRMADLHVLVVSARATAYWAAASGTSDRSSAAATAKVYCSEVFEAVAAECVQIHGGVAITWEHDMQLYFKRAHSSAHLFGSSRRHLRQLERAAGLPVSTP